MTLPRVAGPRLWLDHASVVVPDLPRAVTELRSRLGLEATISPADPEHHSRVHFDRAYFEVSAREPATTNWEARSFFLRFEDPGGLRRHLDSTGLPYRFSSYTGVDGVWDDVEVEGGGTPLPILVRRTEPPEIAMNWPPLLPRDHACGARTLEAVHVGVLDMTAAIDFYSRLLGVEPSPASAVAGIRCVDFSPAAGRIVVLQAERPGIAGLVLGVPSLAETAQVVGPLAGKPVAWLDATAAHGLRLGFVEVTEGATDDSEDVSL